MYKDHWQLKEKPFENNPDPRFFYFSRQHKEMLSRYLYVINEGKQIAMFTGEYGSGKTLLNMVVHNKFYGSLAYKFAMVINPNLEAIDFLKELYFQFKETAFSGGSKFDIITQLKEEIFANPYLKKVIIIDEAQMIEDANVFEELRLLSNLTYENKFICTIIFVGQPQLKEKVSQIPQLRQRIALAYHLRNLDYEESKNYILHRLKIAGAQKPIFSEDSFLLIYEATRGIPRLINTMCDIALVIGKAEGVNLINKKIAEKVSREVMREIHG